MFLRGQVVEFSTKQINRIFRSPSLRYPVGNMSIKERTKEQLAEAIFLVAHEGVKWKLRVQDKDQDSTI